MTSNDNEKEFSDVALIETAKEVTTPRLRATARGKATDEEALWDLPIVKVKAPTDMCTGYQFVVDISDDENGTYLVEVPKNVRAGSIFQARVVEKVKSSSFDDAIPIGEWRHGLWCCKGGTSCLSGWCCPFLALGQIQNRLKMGFKGSFWVFLILSIVHFVQRFSDLFLQEDSPVKESSDKLGYVLVLYLCFMIVRLRLVLADRYAIRADCCTETMMACFCTPCTVIQMIQHTSPHGGANPPIFCTKDGLEEKCAGKIPEHGKMARKFIVKNPMIV